MGGKYRHQLKKIMAAHEHMLMQMPQCTIVKNEDSANLFNLQHCQNGILCRCDPTFVKHGRKHFCYCNNIQSCSFLNFRSTRIMPRFLPLLDYMKMTLLCLFAILRYKHYLSPPRMYTLCVHLLILNRKNLILKKLRLIMSIFILHKFSEFLFRGGMAGFCPLCCKMCIPSPL